MVGLHGKPQPVPTPEPRPGGQRLHHVEGRLQPGRLLGIDRKADPRRRRPFRQFSQPLGNRAHRPGALGKLEARVQGRKLDRKRIRAVDVPGAAAWPRMRADGGEGLGVAIEIPPRVARRHRRLAQHVEGKAQPRRVGGPGSSFFDGSSHDELASDDAHRGTHRFADHRLTGPRDKAAEETGEVPPGVA